MKIRNFLVLLAGAYLLLVLGVFVFQRDYLYFPNPTYVSLSEAQAHASFKELGVTTRDSIELKGWYAPATSRSITFVFFHGNKDNLASAVHIADPYLAAGYGFLIAEYRGYSGFKGTPTEEGLYADGRAYIKSLMGLGVSPEDIILFGHSLGSGVATQMAKEYPVGGVMLLGPFLSVAKMGALRFPYLPADYITLDRFDNAKKIAHINAPLLIANGSEDKVVPPSQGKALYALAVQPRQFYSLLDRGHSDLFNNFAVLALEWVPKAK